MPKDQKELINEITTILHKLTDIGLSEIHTLCERQLEIEQLVNAFHRDRDDTQD
ncbi:hypothetical protein [Hahella sp. HN01]|uniref:hypothetical protein n=1 Tax=Hahella sp. HN01 TaxID=2847262 RepID=UPI001C1EE1A2|nr:hypothetical protein [Hahella sp. HN01]MBU6954560.1 hypothetical protein [Hahella sp. HN01]